MEAKKRCPNERIRLSQETGVVEEQQSCLIGGAMPLKLRTSGLGSGIDKDRYAVYTGEWEVGRIYQTRGGPDSLRWFWSLTVNGPMTRADRVATVEEAKAQFQKNWDAKLEERN
jgi:hypothetical protein